MLYQLSYASTFEETLPLRPPAHCQVAEEEGFEPPSESPR